MNRRKVTLVLLAIILLLLTTILAAGALMDIRNIDADFSRRALSPSAAHPFGTDLLGRDMFT